MSPLCILRSISWSLRAGALVAGHAFHEQQPENGQPKCVRILKCEACSKHLVLWEECARCGGLRAEPRLDGAYKLTRRRRDG